MGEKHAQHQNFMERQKREREERKQTLDGTILLSVQCPRCRNGWNDYLLNVESFTPPVCRACNVHPVLLLNVCWQPDISENRHGEGQEGPKTSRKSLSRELYLK